MTLFRTAIVMLLTGLLLLMSLPVSAHGGGTPQVINAEVGPYVVSIWTQPDPIVTGTVHVTVSLSEQNVNDNGRVEPGVPVLNQEIVLLATLPDEGVPAISTRVTHADATNKLLYEADFDLEQTGTWQMELAINDAYELPFTLDVRTPSPINWTLVGGVLLVVALVGWLVLQRRRTAQSESNDG
jgi:hypothetical protein